MNAIIAATGSTGATPWQTLSRELQELRDQGLLEFVGPGVYRYAGLPAASAPLGVTKGVFVTGSHSIYGDVPKDFYRFPSNYLLAAQRMVGQWIVYLEPRRAGGRGYFAVAKVDKIVPDLVTAGMHLAMIAQGSFLDFGTTVPFSLDKLPMERALLNDDGTVKGSKQLAIRPLNNADFNRIVEIGLMDAEPELPRVGQPESMLAMLGEAAQQPFEGPVDRATMLVSRKVRDAKFRRAVLHVYDGRCALTGMRLVNGGGRLETEAAHIMGVGDGGPDAINNGIALSGTIHWMFDRGLIGLSEAGDILLSDKINDREGVEKMIRPDRRAHWPFAAAHRPHPRYLEWHRQRFGFQAQN
ncbi:HNH endonuclease [Sphingomonas sp.]|uniref:HNH endonuclease n=1 Tax=Sphingomonas sp. TaxID=28214 RepID=UPI00286A0C65|nr:HNH endonuclease [Sphingomonas sp.]